MQQRNFVVLEANTRKEVKFQVSNLNTETSY